MLISTDATPEQLVVASQRVTSHAWVVRAFIRHSHEIDDFPELHEIGRAIFDLARALETRLDDPPGYLRMLAKKLAKFRTAVNEFCRESPRISAHTNFAMASLSISSCVTEYEAIVEQFRRIVPLPPVQPNAVTEEE